MVSDTHVQRILNLEAEHLGLDVRELTVLGHRAIQREGEELDLVMFDAPPREAFGQRFYVVWINGRLDHRGHVHEVES